MNVVSHVRHFIDEGRRGDGGAVTADDLQRWCDTLEVRVHMAVMVEPYLRKIQRGDKYIESRLTKVNIAPFNRARVGDVILFKRSGGAIVAAAEVADVAFEYLRRPDELAVLITRHADGLSYESDYAETKQEARYASLLWLKDVQSVSPVPVTKRGRQAWLTFEPALSARDDDALF